MDERGDSFCIITGGKNGCRWHRLEVWWQEVEGVLMSSILRLNGETKLRSRIEVVAVGEEYGYLK